MNCCGCCHALTRRQWVWGTIVTSVSAMLAGGIAPRGSTAAAQTAATTSAALDVLRKSVSVDVHTHGGTTGIISKAPPNDDLAKGMRAGSLAVACLADVPDMPLLGRTPAGVPGVVRMPAPGELYQYHLDRLAWVDEIASPGSMKWWRVTACAVP
jgi:membrane dipeptidase